MDVNLASNIPYLEYVAHHLTRCFSCSQVESFIEYQVFCASEINVESVLIYSLQSEGQASGGLVFQSLCRFYSAVDPSGLLDLPTSTATAVSATVTCIIGSLIFVVSYHFQLFCAKMVSTLNKGPSS